jgi:hypothetical protein
MPYSCPEGVAIMGYESRHVEIHATVSRHNDDRDSRHDALWDDLVERIRAIVKEAQYDEITAYTSWG